MAPRSVEAGAPGPGALSALELEGSMDNAAWEKLLFGSPNLDGQHQEQQVRQQVDRLLHLCSSLQDVRAELAMSSGSASSSETIIRVTLQAAPEVQ